ncbi:MAG: hypothetical protein JXR83_14865 [Deltaproteobacteria bacterium]|nr:hypothetical protein [Deltaproteobacteria bacterium]
MRWRQGSWCGVGSLLLALAIGVGFPQRVAAQDAAIEDAVGLERRHRSDAMIDPIVVTNGGCQCTASVPAAAGAWPAALLLVLARRRRRR